MTVARVLCAECFEHVEEPHDCPKRRRASYVLSDVRIEYLPLDDVADAWWKHPLLPCGCPMFSGYLLASSLVRGMVTHETCGKSWIERSCP